MRQSKISSTLNNSRIKIDSDCLAEELVELSKEEVSQRIIQIVDMLCSEVPVGRSFKLEFTNDTAVNGGIRIVVGDDDKSHDNPSEIIYERIELLLIRRVNKKGCRWITAKIPGPMLALI